MLINIKATVENIYYVGKIFTNIIAKDVDNVRYLITVNNEFPITNLLCEGVEIEGLFNLNLRAKVKEPNREDRTFYYNDLHLIKGKIIE